MPIENNNMKIIEFTLKTPCENNCFYCPQHLIKNKIGKSEMSIDYFKKIIENIGSAKIHFSGFSEPLLNNRCYEFFYCCYKKNIKFDVYTTLVGLNFLFLDFLFFAENVIVHIPHESMRWYNTFIEKIKIINERYYKYLNRFKFIYNYSEGENIKKINIHYKEMVPKIKIKYFPIINRIDHEKKYKNGITCLDNREYQNVVLPNGDVYICCMDYQLKYRIGNLLHETLDEIHDSKKFKNFQKKMFNGKTFCSNCFRAIGAGIRA